MVEGVKLDVKKRHLAPFGTIAMFSHAGKEQHKFEPRAAMGIVLGPATHSYGTVRAYMFESGRVVNRSHFTVMKQFPETFPWKIRKTTLTMTNTGIENILYKRLDKIKERLPKTSTTNPLTGTTPRVMKRTKRTARLAPPAAVQRTPLPAAPHVQALLDVLSRQTVPSAVEIAPDVTPSQLSTDAAPVRKGGGLGKRHVSFNAEDNDDNTKKKKTASTYTESIPPASTGPAPVETVRPDNGKVTFKIKKGLKSNRTKHTLRNGTITLDSTPARKSSRSVRQTWRDGPARMAQYFLAAYKLSVKDALKGERAQESHEAIVDEILNMLSYKVGHYKLYKDIPERLRKNILHSFMFIKHKTKPDGSYDRTKARFVGNGAHQKEHMYDLISSSTVALSTVFLLFNIASYYRAEMASYDVKGAFLNAKFGPDDPTTYLRINRDITKIWVSLDPTALPYVDGKGEMIIELDKFI
jgi:hypothetical protein